MLVCVQGIAGRPMGLEQCAQEARSEEQVREVIGGQIKWSFESCVRTLAFTLTEMGSRCKNGSRSVK